MQALQTITNSFSPTDRVESKGRFPILQIEPSTPRTVGELFPADGHLQLTLDISELLRPLRQLAPLTLHISAIEEIHSCTPVKELVSGLTSLRRMLIHSGPRLDIEKPTFDRFSDLESAVFCRLAHVITAMRSVSDQDCSITPIGAGSTSVAYRVGEEALLINRGQEPEVLQSFKAQRWCAQIANTRGVNTALMRDVGSEPVYYARWAYAEGIRADRLVEVREKNYNIRGLGQPPIEQAVYFELGHAARAIHSVELRRFGTIRQHDIGCFDGNFGSWEIFSRKMQWAAGLTVDSAFRKPLSLLMHSGAVTEHEVTQLKKLSELIARLHVAPVLCHPELFPENLIISPSCATVIDWDHAFGGAGVIEQLSRFYGRFNRVGETAIEAFLHGYNLPPGQWQEARDTAKALAAVRCFALALRSFCAASEITVPPSDARSMKMLGLVKCLLRELDD